MATLERRRTPERREIQRRKPPGHTLDVTRLEHENLCRQMDEVLRVLRRIESELHRQQERIAHLEIYLSPSKDAS